MSQSKSPLAEQLAMQQWWRSSHLSGGNADYVESLYEQYLDSPNSIEPEWRDMFDKLPRVEGNIQPDISHLSLIHI